MREGMMHGMVNRTIEGFLRDSYGDDLWTDVAVASSADPRGFQTMTHLPNPITHELIRNAANRLEKPDSELLEDIGAWLVSRSSVRRLLRFSGADFREFLHRLDELAGRSDMVMPGLGLPNIQIANRDGWLTLTLPDCDILWVPVIAGLIRAMADDYGALGLIMTEGRTIRVQIPLDCFTEGRDFKLSDAKP